MAGGLFDEFLREIKKGLHEDSHPLNRLKEEKELLLGAMASLEEEVDYILVHGDWDQGVESLYYLRNFKLHNDKLALCKAYFPSAHDIYFISLMEGEQEEIMEGLEDLIHIFRRTDYPVMEKTWRIKALSKLIADQDRREKLFYQMLEESLSEADWRELARGFEELGYLMGSVEGFEPTLNHLDEKIENQELWEIFMALPLKIIYKNKEGQILLIKDLAPDIEVEWTQLSSGGKLYYELKEK